MIPRLDAALLEAGEARTLEDLRVAATQTGFATVYNTGIAAREVRDVMQAYAAFFALPEGQKDGINMARTGANRGWGAPMSEQVDARANPDYKQVFDCGIELAGDDPRAKLGVYAPNLWPDAPAGFRPLIERYFQQARGVAMTVLRGITTAIDAPSGYFDAAFDCPMALLRGNYYPARPEWASARDFGIAEHTDYGCLTLLATDGTSGLEVRGLDGAWVPVTAPMGEFIINFGEMLEMWTNGQVRATPHRVIGPRHERISVPLFFNPGYDTNVAPIGSGRRVLAGDHLAKRFNETYVHLQKVSRADGPRGIERALTRL